MIKWLRSLFPPNDWLVVWVNRDVEVDHFEASGPYSDWSGTYSYPEMDIERVYLYEIVYSQYRHQYKLRTNHPLACSQRLAYIEAIKVLNKFIADMP